MSALTITAFIIGLHVGSQEKCSSDEPKCPAGTTCDEGEQMCVHEPRILGEPCGLGHGCAKVEPNTSSPLRCSLLCGTCVLKRATSASAKPKPNYGTAERCGITSKTTFSNFEGTIVSTMPIVYPKNDTELKEYLSTIYQHNCIARPFGATHTSGAVVTSEEEENTVGISLAEYIPDDESWNKKLDVAKGRVKVPAGISLFDLYEVIRPEGFFLPTQTAGPIFTMAGIVSNSVHGGVYGRGYVSEYMVGLRVAVWGENGEMEIQVLDKEEDLRAWRNSFGLLGVMTGVEFKLERRELFSIYTKSHTFEEFNKNTVQAYFDQLEKDHLYSESFFNPYNLEVFSVLFRKETKIPEECAEVTDKSCKWHYLRFRCRNPTCCSYQYKFGDIHLGQSCRSIYNIPSSESILASYKKLSPSFRSLAYNGSPDMPPIRDTQLCLIKELDKLPLINLESIYFKETFSHISDQVKENSLDVNDGFYLRQVPHSIRLIAYSVPAANLFDLLTIVREVFQEISSETGVTQLGNIEFRFFNISDVAHLMPTTALTKEAPVGEYVNCEVVFSVYDDLETGVWSNSLAEYEKRVRDLNGVVHTGKSFCYDYDDYGNMQPYQNKSCVKSVFNDQQKTAFEAYRKKVDPHGLFYGGAAKQFF